MRDLLICFIFLLSCLKASGQLMPFKNYGIRDGLNDNNVQAVIRDDRGLLWVGTDFALNWFDGKRFYQPKIETKIGQLYITGFYKDKKGTIWVLTFFNGIYKYQNWRFINFPVSDGRARSLSKPVSDMVQISDDKYVVLIDNGAYWFDGKSFSLLDAGNDLLKSKVNSVAPLPNGNIVLGSDEGIFLYDITNGSPQLNGRYLNNRSIIKSLVSHGKIWVLTGRGILRFDANAAVPFLTKPELFLGKSKIKDISSDKNGTIWAYTDNGFWTPNDTAFKINASKITAYYTRNGLPENISQIYCDNEGLVWFANRKGIAMLGDEYYQFNAINNLGVLEPTIALAADDQNNIWAATIEGFALQKKDSFVLKRQVNNHAIGYVTWLKKNKNGLLLAGTNAGVLSISRGAIKNEFNIEATAADVKSEKNWFGCINGDVYVANSGRLLKLKFDHFTAEMINAINYTGNNLWIGYRDRGIIRYKIKKDSLLVDKVFDISTGYSDMRIRCSEEDQRGNLIWGTRTHGVFVISKDEGRLVSHISTKKGLNANWVRGIYCDSLGKVYLATNNGINIVSGNYKTPIVNHIKIDDENINRETNYIFKTGGIFYVGTNEGVIKWIPGMQHRNNVAPPVYFTRISIPGQKSFSVNPYTTSISDIKLPYDEHFVSLEFAGVSLKNPENVRYHYMLEGQDTEWGPVTDRNNVTYNLKPGDYIFKVMAENADGVWSNRPAVFHFIIRPPFWQTWWFVLLIVVTALSAAYGLYRYKLSKIAAMASLRNKISADLHDDIGSTLSSISILSEVAGSQGEQQSKRILGEIKERSLLLMEKMDDIVWSISSKNDTVGDLLLRITQFAATVFEARDIEYEVKVPARIKALKLDMRYRQHIYLILKEAINNLIKYSACSCAFISADFGGGKLNIQITDDGKGFDIKTVKHGNGLFNMIKRAEEICGALTINSEPGGGTIIILSVEIE